MNFKQMIRAVAVSGALLLTVGSSFAATRPRPYAPVADASVTGRVVDATTGAAVADALVTNGNLTVHTAADGSYTIKVPSGRPTILSAQRWGYDASSQTITPNGSAVAFSLAPRAIVTVKDTAGTVYTLDYDLAQFAYLIPLSGYAKSDTGNFCTPGGNAFAPNKSEISKIIGPPSSITDSACCRFGAALAVDVQLRSGQTSKAIFVDDCFGNEVDFISRDRNSGQFVYLPFKNIAEIDFPQ